MHIACEAGQDSIVALLLKQDADATLKDIEDMLPIQHAIINGYLECIKLLVTTTPSLLQVILRAIHAYSA